ncbi:T9SS type A sorting domain-containing protein [Brumimicrobium aurantiacum]|uniref:T9SS C-terminal target domain-containing protein n=1 Tax=Brumimicrobium aurantiacum TaxID=1737063 RepID=A0A3E1EUS9_9FLAO|nr:T9SS type A sorting domain-containing protein [Brumimicrobium aurantiacum]RFC53262.1 T9SS C-terminal target domain-containing protein [Brumimicrobium aurantiacum]
MIKQNAKVLYFFLLLTFPFYHYAQSPGGVSGLKNWFNAGTYNPSQVFWYNSVSGGVTALGIYSPSNVTYSHSNSNWNYNTTFNFDGSGGFTRSVNHAQEIFGNYEGTMIVIARTETSNNSGLCGYYADIRTSGREYVAFTKENSYYYSSGTLNNPPSGATSYFTGNYNSLGSKPDIRTIQFKTTKTGNNYGTIGDIFGIAGWNGYYGSGNGTGGRLLNIGQISSSYNYDGNFSIGEITDNAKFEGSIAEVITFSKFLSKYERNKVESYLAIKYGVTLHSSFDYLSSNGTVIWEGSSTHPNDIIGIGKDSNSDLLQKQSHSLDDSIRVYLNSLQLTNKSNTGNFINDKSFIVLAHNNNPQSATINSASNLPTGSGLYSMIERNWKIKNTNMITKFHIDIKLPSSANLSNINPLDLRLLIDDDGDFSNGGTQSFASGGSSGLTINYSAGIITLKDINTNHIPVNATKYFTIGSVSGMTPLPVKLTDFNYNCIKGRTIIEWTTASESNNDYFTVEKSTEGNTYDVIKKIEGKGNTSSETHYSIVDETKNFGTTYYRLSQTDFDGKKKVLETITSNCNDEKIIQIYPNPTSDDVYLALNSNVNHVEVQIYNLLGQPIKQEIVTSSRWLQLPNQNGIYLLKYNYNNEQFIEKIIKT